MSRPDETLIVDRDEELGRFRRLVRMEEPRRVMVVSSRSGTGKTDLMRKLRLHCDRDFTVPVALAHLGDFQQRPDEFSVVECLHKALKKTGADLPHFEELDKARGFRNTVAFLDRLRSVAAFVNMTNAAVSGAAKVAAMMFNIERADNVTLPEWNEETDAAARDLCVEAFLADLDSYSRDHTVVLLFDGLNEVAEELRMWVLDVLVRRGALTDWENRRLVVALAGEGPAALVTGRLPEAQRSCVEVVTSFGVWDQTQVQSFLEANGFTSLTQADVEVIHRVLVNGASLTEALAHATIMATYRGGR